MHIKKYNRIRNLVLLCIAGNMVGWLFPFPHLVWRLLLVLLSLYVILFEEGKRLPCEKAILVFAAFNLLHFFISFLWKNPSTTQIGNILCALLPMSMFVYLSQKGVMNNRFITITGLVLLFTSILQYYYAERMAIIRSGVDEDTDITNSATASFLMLLPILFLMKNNIQKWVTLIICIFFLVMGAKRGNILAAFIPLVLFVHAALKNSRRSGIKTVLVLALIIGAAFFTYRWVTTNDYLMKRIEQTKEGNTSGRDVIYAGAWHSWYDSNEFITYLLGYGFDGTLQQSLTTHRHAHNDWLEVLVDYGLVGVFVYLSVFVTLAFQIKKVKSYKMRMLLWSAFFIWFFKSLYSMGFTGETLSVLMISMGTALGQYKLEEGMT